MLQTSLSCWMRNGTLEALWGNWQAAGAACATSRSSDGVSLCASRRRKTSGVGVAGDSQGGDGWSWGAVWLLCLGVVRTRQQDERRDVMLDGGEKRVVGASWSWSWSSRGQRRRRGPHPAQAGALVLEEAGQRGTQHSQHSERSPLGMDACPALSCPVMAAIPCDTHCSRKVQVTMRLPVVSPSSTIPHHGTTSDSTSCR